MAVAVPSEPGNGKSWSLAMNGRVEIDADALLRMIDAVNDSIRGRNIAAELPGDFWTNLVIVAGQLANRFDVRHGDPNITLLWCVSLVLAAWVGCVPKAKLYSLAQERPELTDEKRQEMAEWLGSLGETIKSIYESGVVLAPRFRESKGQENYTRWETR